MALLEQIGLSEEDYESGPKRLSEANINDVMIPMEPRNLLLDPYYGLYLDPNFYLGRLGLSQVQAQSFYFPLLLAGAASYQLVPASEYSHHVGFGGLAKHSIHTACGMLSTQIPFYINQEAKSSDREWTIRSSARALLFAIGMFHDIGKLTVDMEITAWREGSTARAMVYSVEPHDWVDEPLYFWLMKHGFNRYRVAFREGREIGRHSRGAFEAAARALRRLGVPLTPKMREVLRKQDGGDYHRILELLKASDANSVELERDMRVGAERYVPQICSAMIYMNEKGLLGKLRVVDGKLFISRAVISLAAQSLPNWDDFADVRSSRAFTHMLISSGVAEPPDQGKSVSCFNGKEGVFIPLHTGLAHALLKDAKGSQAGSQVGSGTNSPVEHDSRSGQARPSNSRLITFLSHLVELIDQGGGIEYEEDAMTVAWSSVFALYSQKHPRPNTLISDMAAEGLPIEYSKEEFKLRMSPLALEEWLNHDD